MDKAAEKKKSDRIALTICFLLALMVWGVFGQTLRYDFVNYDDGMYVHQNRMISKGITPEGIRWAFTHPHAHNWHPLTSFSHMLDAQLYGLNPAGHHRTNVLLHMATVILFFLVLRQMTGSLWRSAFAAAVFAIHPLRAESVAWISERKDVLSGFFFMLTLAAYLRYVRRPFSAGRYAAVAVLFVLGLMSKPMLVTTPFVLLLLDFWPLGRFQTLEPKKTIIRLVLEKIPLLLLTAVFCGITVWTQHEAIASDMTLPVLWRLGNAFCSYAIYIKQMFFPAGLAPLYPHQGPGLPLWEIGTSIALLIAVSWGVFAGRKKYPYLITGWFWYLGMLVPVIGIMQVGAQAHADRYTYLSQIGLVIMATWLAADWCAALRYRRAVLSTTAAALLVSLAITAYIQTRYWRDSFSLWTHTLTCTDRNYLAHRSLGLVFYRQGKHAEAVRQYKKSIEINPHFADTYNNLGFVLDEHGKVDEAIACYEKALQINPDLAEAHSNLGAIFSRQGQAEKAILHLEKALQINPDLAEAHNNLGSRFSRQIQFDKAIPHFQKALQINPGYAEAHFNLGLVFFQQGQLIKAIPHLEDAIKINPEYAEAHSNLGAVFSRQGQPDKAIQHFEKALQINPEYAEAHYNLGVVFSELGQFDKAIPHFEKALRINPEYAEARSNLGTVFAALGQFDKAIPHFEKALQINPEYAKAHSNLGVLFSKKGLVDKAISYFERALQLDPGNAKDHCNLGNLFLSKKNFQAAIQQYDQAIQVNPDYVEAENNLAWILATCPDVELRDGKRAVDLARSADRLSGETRVPILNTLAAAYAEAGQYPEAVATARRALDLATGQKSDTKDIRMRLRLYEAGVPYHESRGEP